MISEFCNRHDCIIFTKETCRRRAKEPLKIVTLPMIDTLHQTEASTNEFKDQDIVACAYVPSELLSFSPGYSSWAPTVPPPKMLASRLKPGEALAMRVFGLKQCLWGLGGRM